MQRTFLLSALALVALTAVSLAKGKGRDATATYLAKLRQAAKCDDAASPGRAWCIAADRWQAGKAAPLPTKPTTLIGITIELEQGKSVADALSQRVYVSALALRTEGKETLARISTVKPTNDDEIRQLGLAVAGVALVLKGAAETTTIEKGLADYVATLPAKATYPVKKSAGAWVWKGASSAQLRQVGAFWVAIETPDKDNGRWVSIFTDRFASE